MHFSLKINYSRVIHQKRKVVEVSHSQAHSGSVFVPYDFGIVLIAKTDLY